MRLLPKKSGQGIREQPGQSDGRMRLLGRFRCWATVLGFQEALRGRESEANPIEGQLTPAAASDRS